MDIQKSRNMSAAKTIQTPFDLRKIMIRQLPPLAIFAVLGVV
jgi:hypothetical protein